MRKIFILITAVVLSVSAASAQDYKWAAGVRGGGEMSGMTVKYKMNSADAIEAMISFPYKNGVTITGLYERYIPVITDGFHFYYGAGAHIGSWDDDFSLGVDGIVGLEYKIPTIPLSLSVDYKPVFNIATDTKFFMADIALGIKVTF